MPLENFDEAVWREVRDNLTAVFGPEQWRKG
jgi:hypothetical protein